MSKHNTTQSPEITGRSVSMTGLVLGPLLFIIMFNVSPSEGLGSEGIAVAAVATWMAIWWMTEAVPLAVTALLPLALFPVLGVNALDRTAQSYAHPLIFLFLGGFILARAMEQWNLHKRLAFFVLRLGGSEPTAVIGSLMVATAFLSMWISNTATTMVMLPIGQALVATMRINGSALNDKEMGDFGAALMLGIAFAATIGGIGSLIGTPPNALFAGYMRESHGVEIGFAQWMLLGVPIVLVLLPITWLTLTRLSFRIAVAGAGQRRTNIFDHLETPGPMSRGEIMVAVLMLIVAALWIFRPLIQHLLPSLGLSDAGIAITAAVVLFILPVDLKGGERLIRWKEAATIRWDVLILFGGGLALAGAIADSGLAAWVGSTAIVFKSLPVIGLILIAAVIIVYLGELASNTAMAAIFLPIAGATAIGLGEDPLLLTLPVVLAASLGFMLPVATPPNAIVFGSGAVSAGQMLRAGALLDIIGIVVVMAIGLTLGPLVFPGG